MAEWKERGYVPDSDDENDDELELPNHDDVLTGAELDTEKKCEEDAAENEVESTQSDARVDRGLSGSNEDSIALEDGPPHHPAQSREGSEFLHQAENKPNEIASEGENDVQKDAFSHKETVKNGDTQSTGSVVAEQLQNELKSGLEIVKEILSGASSILDDQSDNASDSSSPLSSSKSFPAENDPEPHNPEETLGGPLTLDNQSVNKHINISLGNSTNHSTTLEPWMQPTRRNLRQRNAIQIHPYALEGARYQRELLARGIKPIYVGGPRRRMSSDHETPSRDFQEGSLSEESANITSSQRNSSSPLQPISNNAVRKRALKESADSAASDEELPDLSAILQGKHGNLARIKKRRNLQTIWDRNRDIDSHMYDLPSDPASFTLGGNAEEAVFHVPPSPPLSRAIHSSQGNETLHRTRKQKPLAGHVTPQALPTPNTSSEARFSTQLPLQIHEDLHYDETNVEEESSSPISQCASGRADSQILQLQRKTKGVLPASFFRLQEQQKQPRAQTRRFSLSPVRNIGATGVAHRLARRRDLDVSPSRVSNNNIIVSDDSPSEDDSSSEEHLDPASLDSPNLYSGMMGLVDGDIEEDNTIDTMVQPQSRKRRQPNPTRKRQRRISKFSHTMNGYARNEHTQIRSPERRKGPVHLSSSSQRRNGKSQKAGVRSLGPLDSPDYTTLPRSKQPQFLRVATRRARFSKTSGRQSPGRKFLKLATSADTCDVNTELENWRTGKYQQRSRAPLDPARGKRMQQQQRASPLHRPVSGGSRNFESTQMSPRSRSQSQVELRSPPRQRIEDVINAIVLRQSKQTGLSLDESAAIHAVSDASVISGRQPPAPVHARLQNRSGRAMLLPSAIDFAKLRDAQLEGLAHLKPRNKIRDAFHGHLIASNVQDVQNAAIEVQAHKASARCVAESRSGTLLNGKSRQAFPRILRKRPPQHININFLEPIRQTETDLPDFNNHKEDLDPLSGVVFAGLGSPEFPLTQNFGIVPCRSGTYMHESTFVGQGKLSQLIRKLIHQPRNFIQNTSGVVTVNRPSISSSTYHWGVWDDRVSQEFSAWFAELQNCLGLQGPQDSLRPLSPSTNVLAAITSLTSYLSCHASFRDSQTIITCAEDANQMARDLVFRIESELKSRPTAMSSGLFRFLCLLLVFIFGVACLVDSVSTSQSLQMEICSTFKAVALVILKENFRDGRFVKIGAPTSSGRDEFSIGRDDPEIDALVVVNNLSKQTVIRVDMWELITEALQSAISFIPENSVTFQDYDHWWKGIFSTLPLLELDETGLLVRRSSSPGWHLVQRLLTRFLLLFMPRRCKTGYSTKCYGRILIQRCFDLVQTWGWQGGHSVAGALFDAYTSNDLDELFGETPDHHFCVPVNLDPSTRIYVDRNDSGFHTFLGLLAQTILNSRRPDADQKLAKRVLRSLSARLVPTKGGDIPRNKVPSLHDIIALRNRFDLASVMYCAMPTELKPSIRLFQSFVDFSTAHHEACQLALDCWSRIVHHAALAEESLAADGQKASEDRSQRPLLLLREWHDSMIMGLIIEYTSTNDQALGLVEKHPSCHEQHYILADVRKPIAEMLKEVLKASAQSFQFCRTPSAATELFSQRMLGDVLQLFDVNNPTQNTLVSATLQNVISYTHQCTHQTTQTPSNNDDSQEYGSWDEFDVMEIDNQVQPNLKTDEFAYLLNEVRPWLRRFLSNVFGSDAVPDHAILKNTADCWYEVANALVRVKARSWDDFVGQYSTDSWDSLRHTQQSQQYKVYFLAKVADSDYSLYERNRVHILVSWISALCRPNHLLCWEHLLSSVILFHDFDNELLFNPPFAVRTDAGMKLEIPMTDLRERRTAMIYVVLRNIHRLMAMPFTSMQTLLSCSKADILSMLKGIESTMKACYLELEPDIQAQKEYRLFINFVVQQMQLYVADFHKIDVFFMDPAISLAEEYAVTAALKRYGLTIETTGITKAMILFLYNASERAAVTDNQDNITLQLCNAWLDLSQDAIESTENHGSDQALLILSLHNVFPAYISHAFSAPGYIIARPLLRVLTYIYQNLRCRSDFWNPDSCHHLIAATEVILRSAVNAFMDCRSADLASCPDCLYNFNELVTFVHAAMLRAYEAAQIFPDNAEYSNIIEILLLIKDYILAVDRPSNMDSDFWDIEFNQEIIAETAVDHSTIKAYAEKELQNALDKTWRPNPSGGWQIIGRGVPKVVKASRRAFSGNATGSKMEHCKQRMKFVVRGFVEAFMSLDWWE